MRYYIHYKGSVFTTNWFDVENHFQLGMIVIDTFKRLYYVGGMWIEIEEDHL